MPGILPMKVIKVGTSAQSRIAQACDRCRSKKIRCDGVRPTCSQCANVGFECKTSDKLSRRAFPRGYTESLEERVRALETEVRELKDLLDEKDEKIDMLSKMHGGHHYGRPAASNSPKSSAGSPESRKELTPVKEDTFRVQASPLLLGVENSDSFFMGGSSGRPFIEAFKRKIQESGKQGSDFNPDAFLHTQGTPPLSTQPPDSSLRIPPRMYADRCVNVYFQEWAPLFPVLHKPTFLGIYADFFADHDKIKSNHKIAQLYLVFSIAGLSSESPDIPQLVACEQQWTKALESVLLEDTMSTLQCLILALMYCAMRADYKRVQHYKSIAVGLSHRLGLHQSQKRFSFGALTIETRKKVFWTLYTLDCFTAATLGLPKLLKEADVQTEYPSDADDEYVTEKGFQPTLPGESTRLSSALALFRATRVLARVLEKNYPATSSYELSLQQMESLEVELDEWYGDLPSHLRLKFVQDKPSTDVTSSRSPLLAMTYYYIRTLIYRPAIGSTLGSKAAPALMSISDSSKHIIQIVELLEERGMNFSFCLNKGDLLTLCGMTLLYRSVGLKAESKLMKDDGRLINSVFKTLLRNQVPGTYEFQRIASKLIAMDQPSVSPSISEQALPTPTNRASPTAQQRKKSTSSLSQQSMRHPSETETIRQGKTGRLSMNDMDEQQRAQFYRSHSRHSFDSVQDSSVSPMSQVPCNSRQHSSGSRSKQNLDYLSLSNTPLQSRSGSPPHNRNMPLTANRADQTMTPMPMGKMAGPVTNAEWEAILGSMDGGLNNVYDAIYGGSAFINEAPLPSKNDWSPDTWDLANFNINEFGQAPVPPQSVLSLSDESLSSGEEVSPSDLNLGMGNIEYSDSNGFIIENFEGFPL